MRLVCPNCEAKYEVPEDAIPDTGRDVQCTNCGHSWFQMRGRVGATPLVAPAPEAEAVAAVEPSSGVPVEVSEAVEPVQASPDVQTTDAGVADVVEAVRDATEAAVVEVMPHDVASSEAAPVPEAEPGPALEGETPAQVLADAETVALNDVEALAEGADSAAPEPVIDLAPAVEIETTGDVKAGSDLAEGTSPMPDPAPVADAIAELEATVAADETGAGAAVVEVQAEAVPDVPSDAAKVTASDDGVDDAPAPATNYAVDDSVLAILREEAEREANARRAEALESQTDLGIDSAMPRKAGLLSAEAETKTSARRDLLPDVEEINSTLRPSEMHDAADAPDFVAPPPEAPSGFRSGFLSLMTVAILAAALYLVAPRLAVIVPALAGPLESYISMIDSLRLGLDGMMRSATVAISDG